MQPMPRRIFARYEPRRRRRAGGGGDFGATRTPSSRRMAKVEEFVVSEDSVCRRVPAKILLKVQDYRHRKGIQRYLRRPINFWFTPSLEKKNTWLVPIMSFDFQGPKKLGEAF